MECVSIRNATMCVYPANLHLYGIVCNIPEPDFAAITEIYATVSELACVVGVNIC